MNLNIMLPELTLSSVIFLLLLITLLSNSKNLFYFFTQFALIATSLVLYYMAKKNITLFSPCVSHGQIIFDNIGVILKLLLNVLFSVILISTRTYMQEKLLETVEYYALMLLSLLGMYCLISSASFVTLFVSLELTSLPLYALSAIDTRSKLGLEAAMKYFILGSVASCIILFGMSLIYGSIGSLDFSQLQVAPSYINIGILKLGILLLIIGVFFKFGLAPFHMWLPDVYQGAPLSVTMLVASLPKIATFIIFYRLFATFLQHVSFVWYNLLIASAVFSLLLGNMVAVQQKNLMRMLAYSTMSHMGFIFLSFLSNNVHAQAAGLNYLLIYVLIIIGAISVIINIYTKTGIVDLKNLADLNKKSPLMAALLAIFMLSLAGIPPFAGFYAKFLVLKALIDAKLIFIAVFALLMSVVGAFYYLRVIWYTYFIPSANSESGTIIEIKYSKAGMMLTSLNGCFMLILGVVPFIVFKFIYFLLLEG